MHADSIANLQPDADTMNDLRAQFAALCERLHLDPSEALSHLNSCESDAPVEYANILPFTLPETDEL